MAKLEELRELAKAVHRNKVKNIHIIGNQNDQTTIFDTFYRALLDDKFKSDEEYAQFFYGKSANHKAYYKLKDRLQERLINTIFFVDVNKKGLLPIQKAYYFCYKNSLAVKILLGKRLRNPAIKIAEKTLKKSLIYGFTDINIELARHLSVHYSSIVEDQNKFLHYNKLIRQQLRIYEIEITAEEFRLMLTIQHTDKTGIRPELLSPLEEQFKYLKTIIKKYSSYKIILNTYLFFLLYLELKNDWQNIIKISNELFSHLKEKPQFSSPMIVGIALSRKLVSLFILNKYEESQKVVTECLTKFPPGHFNWLFVSDVNFRIQLHNRRFEKAKQVFFSVEKNKDVNLHFNNWTEIWKINEAFIHYLIRIGKIQVDNDNQFLKPFRLKKFLNEVPTYSKDKRGSNITILILQVLFLLEDQKYNTIIDRTESLRAYTFRYLKDDDTFRSNCFIKMLMCLPKANFKKKKVEAKAKQYFDHLLTVPIEKAKQSAELEVMPYEMLWEFVLESLDREEKISPYR